MEAISASTDLTARVFTVSSVHIAENAGSPAAARVLLRNGGSGGTILCDIRVAASDSKHVTFPRPARFPSGLYVEVNAGSVRGAVVPQ